MRGVLLGLAMPVLGGFASAQAYTLDVPRPIAIEHVRIIDVQHGRLTAPRTVLVTGERITAVGRPGALRLPARTLRIDGRGRFLLPGLVDLHVHLFNHASGRAPNEWALPMFVAHGVTAVREMNAQPGDAAVLARWEAEAAKSTRIAPRFLAVGMVVRADDDAAMATAVAHARASGASFVKTFSDLDATTWQRLLRIASLQDMAVMGHVPATISVLEAARAGQRSNEHLTQLVEACARASGPLLAARLQQPSGAAAYALAVKQEPELLDLFDPVRCARIADALAQRHMAQVPTLVLAQAETDEDPLQQHPLWPQLRADEQQRWLRLTAGLTAPDRALAQRRDRVSRVIVGQLARAGVPLLAGTDSPMPRVYPGLALHEELQRLVAAGVSPAAALRGATVQAWALCGRADEGGSVAVGQYADLLLLDANPLLDIRNTRAIHRVIVGGRLLEQ